MKDTRWDHGLKVAGEGEGLVGHAGAVLLRKLAGQTGLACIRLDGARRMTNSARPRSRGGWLNGQHMHVRRWPPTPNLRLSSPVFCQCRKCLVTRLLYKADVAVCFKDGPFDLVNGCDLAHPGLLGQVIERQTFPAPHGTGSEGRSAEVRPPGAAGHGSRVRIQDHCTTGRLGNRLRRPP